MCPLQSAGGRRFAEGKHHGNFRDRRNVGGDVAYLFRLVFLALLWLSSSSAFALLPSSTVTSYRVNSGGVDSGWQSSATGACQGWISAAIAYDGNARTFISVVGTNCNWTGPAWGGSTVTIGITNQTQQQCPANSSAVTGGCQCNTGFVESGGQCIDTSAAQCSSLSGQSAGSKVWNGTADSFSFCDGYNSAGDGKCIVTAVKDISFESPPGSGNWMSQGTGSYTGGKAADCTGQGGTSADPAGSSPAGVDGKPPIVPAPDTAAPAPCPTGQAPGEVNGQRVCAPLGSDTPTTAPAPKNGTNTVTNPDGTSTTTTTGGTTTCSGSTCTTTGTRTVVNRNAAGEVTSSETTSETNTQTRSSFCEENGKSAQCAGEGDGKGGSFTGNCAAGFKADGDDPVLNAMAQEQYTRNCEVLKKDSAESQAYDAIKDVDGTTKAANPNNSEVSIGAGSFDTSDAIGGGGCNLNKTIVVAGRTVVLPINDYLCNPLAIMGQLLVAVSLLLAARIVTRG